MQHSWFAASWSPRRLDIIDVCIGLFDQLPDHRAIFDRFARKAPVLQRVLFSRQGRPIHLRRHAFGNACGSCTAGAWQAVPRRVRS